MKMNIKAALCVAVLVAGCGKSEPSVEEFRKFVDVFNSRNETLLKEGDDNITDVSEIVTSTDIVKTNSETNPRMYEASMIVTTYYKKPPYGSSIAAKSETLKERFVWDAKLAPDNDGFRFKYVETIK